MVHLTRSRVAISGSIVAIFTVLRVVLDQTAINALQRQTDDVTHSPLANGIMAYSKPIEPQESSIKAGHERHGSINERPGSSYERPANVLVLGYMRGGSSFVGDLYNQHDNIFYWYEPLDGVYSALFGTPYGWTPLDITHTLDGEPRRLSNTEEEAILSTLVNIYNCDFTPLPTEVLSHRFVDGSFSYSQSSFAGCLYYTENFPSKSSEECKSHLQSVCPQSFEDPRTYTCYEFLQKGLPNITNSEQASQGRNMSLEETGDLFTSAQIERFHEHNKCLNVIRNNAQSCLHHLQRKCRKASAVVIKTIRMRMNTVELLLRKLPRVKVVHVLRDPVPIVLSRYRNKLMSAASGGMVITEAVVMCAKIADDIQTRRALEARSWPQSFHTVYLDDLPGDPLGALDSIYKHSLGIPRPADASFWMEQTYKDGGNQFHPCSNVSSFRDEEREEFATEYCYEGFLDNLRKACLQYYMTVNETRIDAR